MHSLNTTDTPQVVTISLFYMNTLNLYFIIAVLGVPERGVIGNLPGRSENRPGQSLLPYKPGSYIAPLGGQRSSQTPHSSAIT